MRSRSEASGEAGPPLPRSGRGGEGGAEKTRPRRGGGGGGGGGLGGGVEEPLDVVEVEVGEEDVEAARLVGLGEAETADPGAGVECEERAVGEGDADAGGVAAVADRFRTGGRDRAARPPELDLHAGAAPLPPVSEGQKTAIAP